MRLFTGISLPETILYSLESFLAPLRPLANIRWTPVSNLHITTRFIGGWSPERVPELRAALASVSAPPFELALAGLGWFPNPHSPHVFWMGVKAGDALCDLAARTEAALAELGCPKEERAFSPHLTLARTRREARLGNLRRALDSLEPPAFPAFAVPDFHLYQSDGGVYRKLQTFSLLTAPARNIE